MKNFTLTLMFICTLFFNSFSQPGFTSNLLFVAKLEGDQEVPPISTSAVGEASFALNAAHDSLCINVTVKGLSGPLTGAHIHEGRTGGIGPVVIDLTNNIEGSRISTVITAPDLNSAFISKLMNGDYYINVHTAANPGGEIRGPIVLEADYPFLASLDGSKEVPAVATNGTGLVTFDLSRSVISLRIRGNFQNLTGPITGIHLHAANPDTTGPVVEDLMSGLNGNRLDINVDPTAYLSDLMNGRIYINVHTLLNPNGEIRAQVLKQRGLVFDAVIDGQQEVPPVSTPGFGVGMMWVNSDADSLWYDFLVDSLSSSVTSAHFHKAAMGTSGGVEVDLTSGINGNRLSGVVSPLPSGFIDESLMGNIYVNFHTGTNPGGEIRGQMMRYAREGFTYIIDGGQVVPSNTGTAVGSGIASIDRDADNLHFRMIVTGLTDTITDARFYNASSGSTGNAIFDLNPYFTHSSVDDAAFNYWLNTAGFDSANVNMFLNDQVYVSVSTSQFPNGEVRGQVIQGGVCKTIITSVHAAVPLSFDFSAYPNPNSDGLVNVSFTGIENGNGNFELSDISGRRIYSQDIPVFSGENKFQLPLNVQSGIYLLKFSIGQNDQIVTRIIKQ